MSPLRHERHHLTSSALNWDCSVLPSLQSPSPLLVSLRLRHSDNASCQFEFTNPDAQRSHRIPRVLTDSHYSMIRPKFVLKDQAPRRRAGADSIVGLQHRGNRAQRLPHHRGSHHNLQSRAKNGEPASHCQPTGKSSVVVWLTLQSQKRISHSRSRRRYLSYQLSLTSERSG